MLGRGATRCSWSWIATGTRRRWWITDSRGGLTARGTMTGIGSATGGALPSVTCSTTGSSGRSKGAKPGTSSSSPITSWERAAAASRSRTSTNGAAGTGAATGSSPERRPGWELPIHQLMVKHGVTIFFQGHDHLFARQERDGIVYQEVPIPADQNYVAYNEDRYRSGVKLPNSGHLRVTVSPEEVKVDYVRCYLPKDETDERKTGEVAHSYTIKSRTSHA